MTRHAIEVSALLPSCAALLLTSVLPCGAHAAETIAPTALGNSPSPAATNDPALPARPPSDSTESAPAKEQSHRHFASGIRLFEDRNYSGALAEFEASYSSFPSGSALQNVALCQKQLYRYSEAKETLLRLLAAHGNELTEAERTTVRDAVTELGSLVGSVRIAVYPKSAIVNLDGRSLDASELERPISLDVGEHRISAEADGFAPYSRIFRVSGGHIDAISLNLTETTGSVEIIAPDAQTAIAIDGRPVAFSSYSGRLTPGRHFVQIYREGFEPYEEQLDVAVGDKLRVVGELGDPTETETADAALKHPTTQKRILQGWYGYATTSLLAVRGHPVGYRANTDYDFGYELGMRAGYRFATPIGLEAILASGSYVVQGHCSDVQLTACPDARATAYHLDTRRIGAGIRLLSQGEGSRLYSVIGTGAVAQNVHAFGQHAVGFNPYVQLELGFELNYRHSLWAVSFVGSFDGASSIRANSFRPFESASGIQLFGVGLRVGWGEWSPPRIVPPMPKATPKTVDATSPENTTTRMAPHVPPPSVAPAEVTSEPKQ